MVKLWLPRFIIYSNKSQINIIEYVQTWIEWLHYSLFTIGLEALYNNLFYIHVGIEKVPMSSIIDRSLTFFFLFLFFLVFIIVDCCCYVSFSQFSRRDRQTTSKTRSIFFIAGQVLKSVVKCVGFLINIFRKLV